MDRMLIFDLSFFRDCQTILQHIRLMLLVVFRMLCQCYAFYCVFASSPFIKRGLPYFRQTRLTESCGYSGENIEVFAQKCVQARNLLLCHCDTSSFEFFNMNYINTIFYFVKIIDSSNVIQMRQRADDLHYRREAT